jgi:hypothetical protein
VREVTGSHTQGPVDCGKDLGSKSRKGAMERLSDVKYVWPEDTIALWKKEESR